MTYQYDSICEFEIGQNEDIKNKISEFILSRGWDKACICSAIGSVKNVVLTTPIGLELPPKTIKTAYEGPAEVLAFTGEIMKKELMDPLLRRIYSSDDPLFIHIHISLACAGSQVYGGGLNEGYTFRGIKVYLAY